MKKKRKTSLMSGGRRASLVATALRRGSLVGVPMGARRGSLLLDGPNAVPAIQVRKLPSEFLRQFLGSKLVWASATGSVAGLGMKQKRIC